MARRKTSVPNRTKVVDGVEEQVAPAVPEDKLAQNISKHAVWFGVNNRVEPGQVGYCNANVEALLLAAGIIETLESE